MQMTFDQARRPGLLSAFALRHRSGYMMRSEKRPGYNGAGGSNRGRRPRRKKAGIPYILLTLLISVILWPVGMVMLWRRKVRMQAGSKLLISMLTLCLSVFLIVFALTVQVDNPRYTAFQDKANDFLSRAEADIAVAGDAAYKKSGETIAVMSDFADGASGYVLNLMADGLDRGVELAAQARDKVADLTHRNDLTIAATTEAPSEAPTEVPTEAPVTEAPEATEAPTEAATQAATEAPTEAATEAPTEAATGEPEEETAEAETEATAQTEAAQAGTAGKSGSLLIKLPESAPDAGTAQPLESGMLSADGELTPDGEAAPETTLPVIDESSVDEVAQSDEAADAEAAAEASEAPAEQAAAGADPTVAPIVAETVVPIGDIAAEATAAAELATQAAEPVATPEPVSAKSAGDAVVYYYSTSKCYHLDPYCSGMNGAPEGTLAEAIAAGKVRCGNCGSPNTGILDEPYIAWVDENDLVHTTDECEDFVGEWRLISLAEAIEADYETCETCRADDYAILSGLVAAPLPEPTVVEPSVALKPAGEAVVYHSTNGSYYHKVQICRNMTGSDPYTLAEMVDSKYKRCNTCEAPLTELVGAPCLWMDEDGLCHTTDDCEGFNGQYTLILRDDALSQGLAACPDCGAEEYLMPNTVLAGTLSVE